MDQPSLRRLSAGLAADAGWAPVVLGFAGTSSLAVLAPGLLARFDGPAVSWWWRVPGSGAWHEACAAGAFAATAAVVVAWLWIGTRLRRSARGSSPAPMWAVAALWVVPLLVAPPLFSRDAYSYVAQAMLVRQHLSPFTHGPSALSGPGSHGVLAAVAPVWRNSASPYGPLFLRLIAALDSLAGRSIPLAVVALRVPEVVGAALVAVAVPGIAGCLGADRRRAAWLAAPSPLVLLELVAAGHNDALMDGLLACGLWLALRRRPLAAVAVCSLAAMVKLPAEVGSVMVAVAWARQRAGEAGLAPAVRAPAGRAPAAGDTAGRAAADRTPADRAPGRRRSALRAGAGALAASAAVSAAVAAAASFGSGLGFGWLSPRVLLTPLGSSFTLTPATALAETAAALSPGAASHEAAVVAGLRVAAVAVAAVVASVAVWRCRQPVLVDCTASVLLAAAVLGPATWPWYLSWGILLLGATIRWQWSRSLVAASAVPCVLLAADGRILVPTSAAAWVAAGWVLVAGSFALRRWSGPGRAAGLRPAAGKGAGSPP